MTSSIEAVLFESKTSLCELCEKCENIERDCECDMSRLMETETEIGLRDCTFN